jgi:hypothetical protein
MSVSCWRRVIVISTLGGCVATGCSRSPLTGKVDAGDAAVVDVGPTADAMDARDVPESGAPLGSIEASDVLVRASGNIVIAGVLRGSVDLGKGVLTSAGEGDLLLAELGPSGAVIWNRRFGDARNQGGGLLAAASQGPSGEILLAVGFTGSLDLGGGVLTSAGAADVCVARFDAEGNHLSSRRSGDAEQQFPTAVAVDGAGATWVTAHSGTGPPNEGSEISKLGGSGELIWTKRWQGAAARALALDARGGARIAGDFRGTVDLGGGALASAGMEDVFVVELTAGGDQVWSKRFGGALSDHAQGVSVDPGGNLFLTGAFNDVIDFGGMPLVSVRAPDRFAPSLDMFVAALDASGAHLWSRSFGDASTEQHGLDIGAGGAGTVAVIGAGSAIDFGTGPLATGGGDGFVVRFDGNGRVLWSRQLPAPAERVRVTPSGAVLVAGAFPAGTDLGAPARTLIGGANVFLIEYAP